jgi:hypothetical protein
VHPAYPLRFMKRRSPTGGSFLPNVNVWQVRAGLVVFVLVPLAGVVWGVKVAVSNNQTNQSLALFTFGAGVIVGLVLGGAYALIAAARRGSFFVDDPAEIERNRGRSVGLGASLVLGLALAGLVPIAALRLELAVGGALCGVMLAWAPIVVAAYVRLERRRAKT